MYGGRGVSPLIRNIGTTCEWLASRFGHSTHGKSVQIPLNWSLNGVPSRPKYLGEENIFRVTDVEPRTHSLGAHTLVSVPTELLRPTFNSHNGISVLKCFYLHFFNNDGKQTTVHENLNKYLCDFTSIIHRVM